MISEAALMCIERLLCEKLNIIQESLNLSGKIRLLSFDIKCFLIPNIHTCFLQQQLSEDGRGVASIANMLTITRIHNSVSAAAAMRRQDNIHSSSNIKLQVSWLTAVWMCVFTELFCWRVTTQLAELLLESFLKTTHCTCRLSRGWR